VAEHVDQVPLLCTLLHGDPSWGGWVEKNTSDVEMGMGQLFINFSWMNLG
jgi:hypothetical protein